MKLKIIFHLSILYNYVISLTIADDVVKTQKPIGSEPSPKPEPNVIEIKLNNDNLNVQSNTVNTVPVNNTTVSSNNNTPDGSRDKPSNTVATITVNIPNGKEQTIEIKNTENFKKEPDTSEKSETFIDKIIDFIRSDFRFLIKCGAIASALLTQVTPLHTAVTIKRNKSTKNLKTLMFATAAFANMLWSLYGILTVNIIIIISNAPGELKGVFSVDEVLLDKGCALVNLLTLFIFQKYCKDQSQRTLINIFCKVIFGCGGLLSILYLAVDHDTFITLIGLLGGSLSAISYTSPLASFNEIIESGNTSAIPTEISLGNFIGSFFMFCYGFIIWDLLIIAPSLLGVISGVIQLALLFIFPHSDRIIISEVEILEKPNNFKSILTIDQNI